MNSLSVMRGLALIPGVVVCMLMPTSSNLLPVSCRMCATGIMLAIFVSVTQISQHACLFIYVSLSGSKL